MTDDLKAEAGAKNRRRAVAYGLALKRLRVLAGLSQAEAAQSAGLSQAAWGKYETGNGLAFLNLLNQEKCVWALGSSLSALEAARASVDAGDVSAPPRYPVVQGAFPLPVEGHMRQGDSGFGVYENDEPDLAPQTVDIQPLLSDGARLLKVAGEDMTPYAEPGGFVIYNVQQPPRRNLGAVVKRHDGRFLIRRYVRATDTHIVCIRMAAATLDGRAAYVEIEEYHPVSEVEGVYPITLRGDGLL